MRTAMVGWLCGIWAAALGAADWKEGFETPDVGTVLCRGAATVTAERAAEGLRSARLARPTRPEAAAPVKPADVPTLAFALPEALRAGKPIWFDGRFHLEKASAGVIVRLLDAAGDGPLFGLSAGARSGRGLEASAQPFAAHLSPSRERTALTAVDLGKWIRLSALVEWKERRFSVWVDDKLALSELQFDTGDPPRPPAGGPAELRILPASVGTAAQPIAGDVDLDGLAVSHTRPEGLEADRDFPAGAGRKLRFAVFGDPQLGFGGIAESIVCFRQGIHEVNRSGADFTIVAGDLVHETTKPLVDTRFEQYLDCAKGFAKPTHPIPGNHDPEAEYRKYIKTELDYDFAAGGLRFIGFQDADVRVKGGTVPAERIRWLRDRLADARKSGEPAFLFTHVPPFGPTLSRDIVGPGQDELLVLFRGFRPVAITSGHLHRGPQIYRNDATVCTVAPGLGMDMTGRNGWLLFDVYADRIEMIVKPLWRPYVAQETLQWPGPLKLTWKADR